MVTPPVNLTNLPTPPRRRFMVSSVETAVLIIALTLLYLYLLKPNQTKLEQTRLIQQDLQQKKDGLEKQEQDFSSIQRKVEDPSLQTALEQLDTALPLEDYVPRLYAALESVAARSAIRGASVRVDFKESDIVARASTANLPDSRNLTVLPASINGAATIDQLQLLLGFVERSPRILTIKKIELKPGSENLLLFTLDLEAYSYLAKTGEVTP